MSEAYQPHIGTLSEGDLHAAIKQIYARPGDSLEASVDGYVIDILRPGRRLSEPPGGYAGEPAGPEGELLIEIQTGGFTQIRTKLGKLLKRHNVLLVHPIPIEKWLLRYREADDPRPQRRKSPKRGRFEELYRELVRMPSLAAHPRLSIEVLLTREEELRLRDPNVSWRRRGWRSGGRRLVEVVESVRVDTPADHLEHLPEDLGEPFTAKELALAAQVPGYLSNKWVYCLRYMGALEVVGKKGRAFLYARNSSD